MGYHVIHMIEAVDWLDEQEYIRLVESCEAMFQMLTEDSLCNGQVCMLVSDKVKKISLKNEQWTGTGALRLSRGKKKSVKSENKILFESALAAVSESLHTDSEWIVILYTAGAIRRSKRTMIAKWRKSLSVQPLLIAVKTEHADRNFLESYTDETKIFDVDGQENFLLWLKKYQGESKERDWSPQTKIEIWEIIRDCFL